MASNTLVEEAKADIEEKGFHKIDDSEIGTKIAVMRDSGLSFYMHNESGFQFCRDHVLLNEYIQNTINAPSSDAGSRYLLVHQGSFAADPGHIYTFRNGGEKPDILIVQAWPRNSRATFYSGSHKAGSRVKRLSGATSLWETAKAQLQNAGYKAESVSFEQGGLVICDARVFFERQEERTYVYSYIKLSVLEQLLKEDHQNRLGVQLPASCDDAHELDKLGIYRKR
ncbi:hypothetical protein FOPG_16802 [Fusarium oxysporum f. sp. conglutinans race 2 54008]|uniref:Uncharacterized protein n=2 Tax=Fusarium oxysporum f. sp. conglutinans TaxID=100902 RepID=A0A8H6G934_FUSOX|nr:hypothetical protein FOPG_16802 [Fusarium oxysporum f. sp. conglutinans race 2 54008]KAF6513703.1 hypothetical protein HZS61_007028 [Fusarium oxysporum f. sp. conglutinans]KAG7003874.1 hypothetical protein FocnCong_v000251 [Fusarium oxysporum f. sp. conglutinans]KAI8398617.1 hypothetical protein FOFC_19832 [Fusarium oxysporum]